MASFNKYSSTIPQEVRELLEPGEIDQVEEFLAQKQAALKESTLKGSLSNLPWALAQVHEALQSPQHYSHLSPEKVAEIWEGLDRVRKSMRKAGFVKPKPPREDKA